MYFVQSFLHRKAHNMLALSHDPNFKTLGFINTLLRLAMSKHQRLWKIIIISHWCLWSWRVEVNDFWLISTQQIKILMLQTILISSRLQLLKYFWKLFFPFASFQSILRMWSVNWNARMYMRACFQKWGSLHDNVMKFQKSNKDKMDSFTCKIIFTILANIPETLHNYPYPNIEFRKGKWKRMLPWKRCQIHKSHLEEVHMHGIYVICMISYVMGEISCIWHK